MTSPIVFTSSFRGIPYAEHIPGSPDCAFSDDGGRITRLIDVAWDDLPAAVELWLGYSEVLTSGSMRYLSRTIPHRHPQFQWLYAQSIPRVEGIGPRGKTTPAAPTGLGIDQSGSSNDTAVYEYARMTVNYTAREYEILPDQQVRRNVTVGDVSAVVPDDALLRRYVSRICRPSGRILTIPRGLMKFAPNLNLAAPDGVPIPEFIGKKVSTLQMTYIWHQVPREGVPYTAIRAQIGTINDAPFDIDQWNFPAGSLLFESFDYRGLKIPRNDVFTHHGFDCQYVFRFEPKFQTFPTVAELGWNYEYRFITGNPIPGTPDYVPGAGTIQPRLISSHWKTVGGVDIPDGSGPYESSNFNRLFRPDQP